MPNEQQVHTPLRGGMVGKKRQAKRRGRSELWTPSSEAEDNQPGSGSSQHSTTNVPSPPVSNETWPPAPPNHHFQPLYHGHRSTHLNNIDLEKYIRTPLSRDKHHPNEGQIYCFTYPHDHRINGDEHPSFKNGHYNAPWPDRSSFVKIGRTATMVTRMKQIERNCGYCPVPLLHRAYEMPAVARVEAIIHKQLRNRQRLEYKGCPGCCVKHQEWFKISPDEAEGVVRMWARFAATRPYTGPGRSLNPFWAERLSRVQLDREDCWEWYIWGEGGAKDQFGHMDLDDKVEAEVSEKVENEDQQQQEEEEEG